VQYGYVEKELPTTADAVITKERSMIIEESPVVAGGTTIGFTIQHSKLAETLVTRALQKFSTWGVLLSET
jgi:hypothetical protein